jgi:uncharacterized SAM-binding protein YcdF (DUF218 family)
VGLEGLEGLNGLMDKYACLQDLWDYLYMEHPLRPADVIIGFGSYDKSTAARAACLYKAGWAPVLLFTGYLGKGTVASFLKPEAEIYADIAIGYGVPADAILIEAKATNTSENIIFARSLLEEKGMTPGRIIAVHKPYMTRRVFAALGKQWPEVEVILAPADISLLDYLANMAADGVDESEIINSIVGDFLRMGTYAQLGWQIPQDIPPKAAASCETLVKMGYGKYVV